MFPYIFCGIFKNSCSIIHLRNVVYVLRLLFTLKTLHKDNKPQKYFQPKHKFLQMYSISILFLFHMKDFLSYKNKSASFLEATSQQHSQLCNTYCNNKFVQIFALVKQLPMNFCRTYFPLVNSPEKFSHPHFFIYFFHKKNISFN